MTFGVLALVALAGILGPLLGARVSWHVPVVVGELAAGVVFGVTGFGLLDSSDQTFTFLADIGFALTMMVAGSHVPVRDPAVRAAIGKGAVRSVVVGLLSVVAGFGAATAFGTGHAALYAVLIASSSAALILPHRRFAGARWNLGSADDCPGRDRGYRLHCCAAFGDRSGQCPSCRCRRIGGGGVCGCLVLRTASLPPVRPLAKAHKFSEKRKFALELRINLVILFSLAALASSTHVSIMLAGFAFGLVLAAIGEPRRLAKQLFAVTDGSSRLSSSSGWERRSICATSSPIRPPSGSDWSWAEQLSCSLRDTRPRSSAPARRAVRRTTGSTDCRSDGGHSIGGDGRR